ncbi:hypothetical protein N7454_009789 [Penicillium verhagenii]|nr:hypothetical protein N7454_009789 [Penicillium verhagenii]
MFPSYKTGTECPGPLLLSFDRLEVVIGFIGVTIYQGHHLPRSPFTKVTIYQAFNNFNYQSTHVHPVVDARPSQAFQSNKRLKLGPTIDPNMIEPLTCFSDMLADMNSDGPIIQSRHPSSY